jgi:hypothetical protein
MKSVRSALATASVLALAAGAALVWQYGSGAAHADAGHEEVSTPPDATYRSPKPPAERRAFFGELHLHTAMSLDAWTFGTRLLPDAAYKFARGETVMVPRAQVAIEQGLTGEGDVPARRTWPLDFAAVTDHSEYLGAMPQLEDPNSGFSKSPTGQKLRAAGTGGFQMVEGIAHGPRTPERDDLQAAAAASGAWAEEMRAANANYQPGKFTTFVAYEWTASPGGGIHMHRNVIINANHAPTPFTTVQSNNPEDLWAWLGSVRKGGIDAIAIPHNSNLSDGRDFDWNMSSGRPIDEAYALQRAANEPLVEIGQSKGYSETTPELSPTDEFARFEIMDRVYKGETEAKQHGSYVREAWGRGLIIQSKVGANPFRMGVVGGTDLHNGLSVTDENAYAGRISGLDPKTMLPSQANARAALPTGPLRETRATGQRENDPLQFAGASVTGVWAEENTRNAIFAALKRKETFATSGTRIRLRMFGGWGFDAKMTGQPNWVAKAYAEGVAMGSDLPARPGAAKALRFVLQAMKDPDGANLDRIQVIKVWLKPDGTYGEKVFDAALSGARKVDASGHASPVGNTVDLTTGAYKNTIGAAALTTVWTDPEFDPKTPAVYYARALEIPTARWTTLLAIREKLPIPDRAAKTIQERAWSSPIWFTPPGAKGRRG